MTTENTTTRRGRPNMQFHLTNDEINNAVHATVRYNAQTGEYDHCNITVLDDALQAAVAQFCTLLMSMSYDDPQVRPLLDLEGLKQWRPGRTEKYALLARAANRFKTIDAFVASVSKSCP